jgi:hypothetical protein
MSLPGELVVMFAGLGLHCVLDIIGIIYLYIFYITHQYPV